MPLGDKSRHSDELERKADHNGGEHAAIQNGIDKAQAVSARSSALSRSAAAKRATAARKRKSMLSAHA
jgi:hypothetical protein